METLGAPRGNNLTLGGNLGLKQVSSTCLKEQITHKRRKVDLEDTIRRGEAHLEKQDIDRRYFMSLYWEVVASGCLRVV